MRWLAPTLARVAAVAAVAVVVSACGTVRFGDIEPPAGRRVIVAIDIIDNKGVSTSDVVGELSSQVQGLSVPADEALVDPSEVGIDARRIESIYAAYGYFRARVVDYWIEELPRDTAKVVYKVQEGPATRVSAVNFLGLSDTGGVDPEADARLAALSERLPGLVPLRPGRIWNERDYRAGLGMIERAFRDVGFVHARVVGDNYVSRERDEAGVYYRIDHGPLVRIQAICILGQEHYPVERILRRVDLVPGDVVEPSRLRDNELAIYELGAYFSVNLRIVRARSASCDARGDEQLDPGVRRRRGRGGSEATDSAPADAAAPEGSAVERPPSADDDDDDGDDGDDDDGVSSDEDGQLVRRGRGRALAPPETVLIEVVVQEMPPWNVTFGFGALTDSVKAQFSLPTGFQHRHLFGELIALRLKINPALVVPDISERWAEVQFGLDASALLDWPSFIEEFLRLSLSIKYLRDPSQDATNDQWSGSLGLSRRLLPNLTGRIGFNVSRFRILNISTAPDLDEALAVSALRYRQADTLTFIDLGAVLDLRQGLYDARKGFYVALQTHLSLPALGSNVEYLRLLGDLRGYLELAPWLTLALRARVGGIFFPEAQGTPGPARFTSGGPSTHRGFASGRMGDFLCSSGEFNGDCGTSATERTYFGGNYLIETNAELRFYLTELVGLVLFADIARLWGRPDEIDLLDPYVAVGPGLRLFTPVGPIRLDFGFLVRGPSGFDWFGHFSLGQAF